jgi:hypothetical protein
MRYLETIESTQNTFAMQVWAKQTQIVGYASEHKAVKRPLHAL